MPRTLNVRELHEFYRRRQAGESTEALAAELGCTRCNLYRRWRRLGLHAHKIHRKERSGGTIGHMAWRMRKEGKTYFDIAEAAGWGRGYREARKARSQLERYCQRVGMPIPNVGAYRQRRG